VLLLISNGTPPNVVSFVVFPGLCLDALTLLFEWQKGHPACKKAAGMLICLGRGAGLHATATHYLLLK